MRKVFQITVTALLISSCGTASNSSLSESDDSPVLMVVMGGHASCKPNPYGMSVYGSFRYLLAQVQRRYASVQWILTCFDNNDSMQMISSTQPNLSYSANAASVEAQVQSMSEAMTGAKIFLIGHSYGGWLGMRLAANVGSRDQKIAGLFTLDPISLVYCSIATPSWCRSAPQDFSGYELQTMAASSDRWVNFFQTNTILLHSSAIGYADINYIIGTRHIALGTDPTVWGIINSTVLQL